MPTQHRIICEYLLDLCLTLDTGFVILDDNDDHVNEDSRIGNDDHWDLIWIFNSKPKIWDVNNWYDLDLTNENEALNRMKHCLKAINSL